MTDSTDIEGLNGAAETQMSEHVARFWQILATENVHILVDMRRDTSSVPYWDSSSFPDSVAKALVADRESLTAKLGEREMETCQHCGGKNLGAVSTTEKGAAPKKIAFERATELAASQLSFFLRGNGDQHLEPTENEKLLAGHIIGNLWANDLLNTADEKWVTVESEAHAKA